MNRRPHHPLVSRTRWWRLLAITAAAAMATVLSQTSASAHNTLLSTTPTDQATVGQTPAAVVLTFDQPAIAMGTRIIITGPNGPAQSGPPQLVNNTVTQPLQPGSPPGNYTVDWRITSTDGHPATGQFHFQSTKAGSGSAPPPAATPANGSAPQLSQNAAGAGLWAAVILLLALAIGTAVLLIRRRAARPNPTPNPTSEPKDTP